ncbi:MAG TPA: formyltransferase family protein, partial [Ktedonobacteraceae bacterium]
MSSNTPDSTLRLAVLLSGSGSNLQALIDAIESKELPGVEIALVVSNNPKAYGLQRALKHALPVIYLPWRQANVGAARSAQIIAPKFDDATPQIREMSENETLLTSLLHIFHVDLIVLAGWLRILSAPFLAQFSRRVINLHP